MEFTTQDERIWIKGLTLECPMMGKALPDCPLNALRHLPIAQVNHTVNHLTDKQVNSIVKIHQQCYTARLKEAKRRYVGGHH